MKYIKSKLKIINKFIILTICILFSGCGDRNPINRVVNPVPSGELKKWSGSTWIIYDDELKTGGGVMLFTTTEGVVIDFNCRDNPYSGSKCIKFSWTGEKVYAYGEKQYQHGYTGFSLIVGRDHTEYDTVTKDISYGNYKKITFYARGITSPNTYLRLEGPNGNYLSSYPNNTSGDITPKSNWEKYEFNLTGDMSNIKHFVNIILKYTGGTTPGKGGTVYIDEIKFEQ